MKKKSLLKRCAIVLMAASIMVCQGNGLIPGNSIQVNANNTQQYTSGFWTYVKYSDGTVGIAAYAGLDEEISIPSSIDDMTVTKIENKAFYNNQNISIVHIPDTVTTIGVLAFAGSSITSIEIPETISTWETQYEPKLPSGVYAYESVDYYSNAAFAECQDLETVVIKSETVPNYAFISCSKLKSVTLGEKTKYIKGRAFKNDEKLEIINVKSDLLEVGYESFWNCKKISEIQLGNRLESIGFLAFAGSGITNITIPETVVKWQTKYEPKLPSGNRAYVSGSYYSNAAFGECPNLEEVNIGQVAIPTNLFMNSEKVNIHCMEGTSAYNCAVENGYTYTLYNNIPSTAVSLAHDSYTILQGTTMKLYPILVPENSTDKVKWTIGNTNIVDINEQNVVTAKSLGLVSVRCTTDSGQKYTFNIEVVASGDETIENVPVKNIELSEVKGITNVEYTGNPTTQDLKVMFNNCTELVPNVDYTVSYKNNTNVGTATVTITGKGNYIGSISKNFTIYDENGIYEWKHDSKGWWYQSSNGSYPKNTWKQINGKWYHFDANGYMQTGWYVEGTTYYYLKSDGTMATNEWVEDGKYYVDASGKWIKDKVKVTAGWKKDKTGWWYQNADGTYPKNEWKKISGKWYHFNANGYMQTGWYVEGTTYYYLKNDGTMATNEWVENGKYYVDANGKWLKNKTQSDGTWKQDSKGWWYQNGDGTYPKNAWKQIAGKWYHFDADGYMQTGWYKEGTTYYYLKSDGSMAVDEWVDNGKYYIDTQGRWVS